MSFRVVRSEHLVKRLALLRRAGGRAALAAAHAEGIVEGLMAGSGAGRQTRNGEARIRHCIKYDLVDGYRLLGVREGNVLALLYVGTHDECDRWVRNNTGLRLLLEEGEDGEAAELQPSEAAADGPQAAEPDPERDDYDGSLLRRIDQRALRRIFHGLCGG